MIQFLYHWQNRFFQDLSPAFPELNLNSPYIELNVKITLAETVLLGDPLYKQNHLMSS